RMVEALKAQGLSDPVVLEALETIPRHGFVPLGLQADAYALKALPIEAGQTISHPFTVGYQSELLQAKRRHKVLEIGTGSGYQTAVLCAMGLRVFSVEREGSLLRTAKRRLEDLDYEPFLQQGDGSEGWALHQPYDRILVTAGSPMIPETLKTQLKVGGRLIIPVGPSEAQFMTVVIRLARNEFEVQKLEPCEFVPLVGKYGF
ncbi:MAG: protein-L-isoaspartate(D-aspartate) O-methyltransferase, partial [Bacteroidota bacterium]